MGQYSIGDLEKITGIKAHTLRVWEKRYNLIQPHRTNSNIRMYADGDLRKLLHVSYLVHRGHRISEVAKMSPREIFAIANKEEEEDNPEKLNLKFNELTFAMMEMSEAKFETIFRGHCRQIGFEATMVNVLFPLLEEMSKLWDDNTIHSCHESFLVHYLKKKIFSAINDLDTPEDSTRWLIFTPHGEKMSLEMLFTEYKTKSYGYECLNLQSIKCLDNLKDVHKNYSPHHVFTVLNTPVFGIRAEDYVHQIKGTFPKSHLHLTGFSGYNANLSGLKKVSVYPDISTFLNQTAHLKK